MNLQSAFWSLPAAQVLQTLNASSNGLSAQDAKQRLIAYGANSLKQQRKSNAMGLLFNQFKGLIILILMFAAVLSIFLQDAADAIILLAIVLISGFLGFQQERQLLGFRALPLRFLLALGAIVALYVITAESVKHAFYQKVKF